MWNRGGDIGNRNGDAWVLEPLNTDYIVYIAAAWWVNVEGGLRQQGAVRQGGWRGEVTLPLHTGVRSVSPEERLFVGAFREEALEVAARIGLGPRIKRDESDAILGTIALRAADNKGWVGFVERYEQIDGDVAAREAVAHLGV